MSLYECKRCWNSTNVNSVNYRYKWEKCTSTIWSRGSIVNYDHLIFLHSFEIRANFIDLPDNRIDTGSGDKFILESDSKMDLLQWAAVNQKSNKRQSFKFVGAITQNWLLSFHHHAMPIIIKIKWSKANLCLFFWMLFCTQFSIIMPCIQCTMYTIYAPE